MPAPAWRPNAREAQTFTQRSDHDLKTDVINELLLLGTGNSDHIGVAVTSGVVTLSGQVDSYRERYNAERAVLGVRGVTAVAEEISVRGTPTSHDTTIARTANRALADAIDVPTGSIQVLVKNQVVTLTGSLRWQFQSQAAERAINPSSRACTARSQQCLRRRRHGRRSMNTLPRPYAEVGKRTPAS